MCLQICLPGCRRSPQSPIVDRQTSIDDRTTSNFRRVFVSFTATPSLPCAFHSPTHDFQRHQEATNRHCRRLEAHLIFNASSIGLSGALRSRLQLPTRASTQMLSLWGNAVAALHCTCTKTFREYFPVGCKKLEFVESATEEEKWL